MALSAALWKLSMDPLLGGVGIPQPAGVIQNNKEEQTWHDMIQTVCTYIVHAKECMPTENDL